MTIENRERENGDVIKYISHGIMNGVVEWLPLFLTPFLPVWRGGGVLPLLQEYRFSVAEQCLPCGGRGFSEARKSPFGMTEEALPHGCDGTVVMHDSANG